MRVRSQRARRRPDFKRGRGRTGSATLELAVVIPLLITLMLVAVDYGRFAHTYIAVTNAARSGAYYGCFHPVGNVAAWQSQVADAVSQELTGNGWYDSNKLVVATPQNVSDGPGLRRVTVDVSYPFQTMVNWPLLPGTDAPFTIRRVVVMRGIR